MLYREAIIDDIPELHRVRMAVRENVLNNPLLVKPDDYRRYLTTHGKGWLCEVQGEVTGFAIVDTETKNIWALFVHPDHEKKGMGRVLHDLMLDWYFNKFQNGLWLGTAPDTRAAGFYKKAGWEEKGLMANGELRFEMSIAQWLQSKQDLIV